MVGFRPREQDRNSDFRREGAQIGIGLSKAAPRLREKRRKGATSGNDPFALLPRWLARQHEPSIIRGECPVEPGRAANARLKERDNSPNRKPREAVNWRESAGITQDQCRESLGRLVHGDERRSPPNGIADDDRLAEIQDIADAQYYLGIVRSPGRRSIGWRSTLRWPIDRNDFKPIPDPGGEACEIAAAVTGGVQTQHRRTRAPTLHGDHTARHADVLDRFICADLSQIPRRIL